jgi:hypothetical protein
LSSTEQVAGEGGGPDDPGGWSGSPARLHTLVVSSRFAPPARTSPQLLPFGSLAWENFERLCLRLAAERGEVVDSADYTADARLYGARGQDQQGIDLYVRLAQNAQDAPPGRRYLCLQARCIANLTPPS